MTKKVMSALILMFVVTVVLILNTHDKITVNLIFGKVKAISSIVYLCFTGIGVIIGILLK